MLFERIDFSNSEYILIYLFKINISKNRQLSFEIPSYNNNKHFERFNHAIHTKLLHPLVQYIFFKNKVGKCVRFTKFNKKNLRALFLISLLY